MPKLNKKKKKSPKPTTITQSNGSLVKPCLVLLFNFACLQNHRKCQMTTTIATI